MRKTVIILCAAIALSSCHHKPIILSGGADEVNEETIVTEKKEQSDKANKPTTLSLAAYGETGKEKDDESKPAMTALISRPDTKVPSEIIKNAAVNMLVENCDSSHSHITQMLTSFNAYFGSDKRSQTSYCIQQTMVIRVPSANFDRLMDALMKESTYTENKDITADDVTAEFMDMEVRLKSKKEVEKRYTELLARAQKVSDVLEVENNLRTVREEIESMEGRLKLLRDQVAYSTITLTATQKLNGGPQPEAGFGYRVKEAVVTGWRGLESFTIFLVAVWPFTLALASFISWIVIRRRRRTLPVKGL